MTATRNALQRAYNALCSAEHELGNAGATEFKNRIAEIRFDLGAAAFPDSSPTGHNGSVDG